MKKKKGGMKKEGRRGRKVRENCARSVSLFLLCPFFRKDIFKYQRKRIVASICVCTSKN